LGRFELGHSQQAHQRRKIRRYRKVDSVADFEIDFGENLGPSRRRAHACEKGSIASRSLSFAVGHDSLLFLATIQSLAI
jgi:hypothetical protein